MIASVKSAFADSVFRLLLYAAYRASQDITLFNRLDTLRSTALFAREHMSGAQPFRSRWAVIDYALAEAPKDGLCLEFGVFRGASLNYLAKRRAGPVHGFDTFTGLPEDWRSGYPRGKFDLSGERPPRFRKNAVIHRGLFSETLPRFVEAHPDKAAFIHIDADLYSAAADVLRLLSGQIVPGTVILFDEYFNHPGWEQGEHKAYMEFLELTGKEGRYLAYNSAGEQVAVAID